jgi:hypothetical protein
MTKVVKEKIDRYFQLMRVKVYRYIVAHDLRSEFNAITTALTNKRIVLFSTLYGSVKSAFTKYSKR